MKRAIITGPTGSIGIALTEQLTEHGVEVLAVCRRGSKRIDALPKNPLVKIVELNLDELYSPSENDEPDKPGLSQEIKRLYGIEEADVFYHFGWDGTFGNSRNNMEGQLQNIRYALDAVRASKDMHCRKFIGAGSQAEYGRVEGLLKADTPAFPENGYGMAKLCAGQMTRGLCEELGIEHIWTRILSIYGPGDGLNTLVMSMIGKLLKGEIPQTTKGEQIWDYLYSKDAGKALYLLGEHGKHGRVYPIGSGEGRELRSYIEKIRDAIDPSLKVDFGSIPYGSKQVMHLQADISQLVEDTGFEEDYSFEDGIRETIAWYREMVE